MVAAALGLWGIFGSAIVSWLRKPKLELIFDRLSEFSEIIGDYWCLRLPVSNRTGRRSATAIEVFLESIREEHAKHPLQLPTYLPVRILWAHDRKAVCDRIAGGAYRLLDLGHLTFKINIKADFVEAVVFRLPDANPVALGFITEIDPAALRLGLPVGSYIIGFLVASDSSAERYRFKLTVRGQPFEPKAKLERYLHIEPA
jgi:hypothetical protein